MGLKLLHDCSLLLKVHAAYEPGPSLPSSDENYLSSCTMSSIKSEKKINPGNTIGVILTLRFEILKF